MKLYSLLSAVVLGMAVLVHAQEETAPLAPIGAYLENRMETLILKAGPLTEVVAQVERGFKDDPKKRDVDLPNLVYAHDARDAVVPGDLTLRRVTPVQALALVAAAAGCTFQPIFAPDEKAGQKTMIIGYRIVLQAASGSGTASDRRAMNTPVSPFGSGGASSGSSLSRPNVRVVDPNAPGVTLPGGDRSRVPKNSSAEPAVIPVDNNQPFVRVYAIGFIMTGTDEEKGTKMKAVDELIRQALNQAKLDLNPDLNIHGETGTLITKATAAQHEIIEQVVQALKENATLLAAPAKP